LIAGDRRRISAIAYTPTVAMLTTRDGPTVIDAKAKYWSKIAIFAPIKESRRNIAITCGVEKLERCGYPTVKLF